MKLLPVLLVFFFGVIQAAAAGDCSDVKDSQRLFVQVGDSDNLSQLIRSNTCHYWGWMKDAVAEDLRIEPWLRYEGLVMGDPHLGNFSPVLVSKLSGQIGIEMRVVDFDDVGVGPFVIDLARLIVATEAIHSSVKKLDLVEAYIYGLNSPNGTWNKKVPKQLEKALTMKVTDYYDLLDKYIDKKTNSNDSLAFKFKKGDLEKYTEPMKGAVIEFLGKDKVLSVAKKIIDRGGSKDALRLWVLIKEDGRLKIIELKEWLPSGVQAYKHQPPIQEILPLLYEYFWPGISPEGYSLKNLQEKKFWIREKTISLIDIPYKVSSKSEKKFISEYGQISAFILGRIHGRQKNGVEFLKYIESYRGDGPNQLKEVIEPYVREYLDVAEQELH